MCVFCVPTGCKCVNCDIYGNGSDYVGTGLVAPCCGHKACDNTLEVHY